MATTKKATRYQILRVELDEENPMAKEPGMYPIIVRAGGKVWAGNAHVSKNRTLAASDFAEAKRIGELEPVSKADVESTEALFDSIFPGGHVADQTKTDDAQDVLSQILADLGGDATYPEPE